MINDFDMVINDIEKNTILFDRIDEINTLNGFLNNSKIKHNDIIYYIYTDLLDTLLLSQNTNNLTSGFGTGKFQEFNWSDKNQWIESLIYIERTESQTMIDSKNNKQYMDSFNNFVYNIRIFNRYIEYYISNLKKTNTYLVEKKKIRFEIYIYNISYFLYIYYLEYMNYFDKKYKNDIEFDIELKFKDIYYNPLPYYIQKYRENTEKKCENPIFRNVKIIVDYQIMNRHLTTISIYNEIKNKNYFCEKMLKYIKK